MKNRRKAKRISSCGTAALGGGKATQSVAGFATITLTINPHLARKMETPKSSPPWRAKSTEPSP